MTSAHDAKPHPPSHEELRELLEEIAVALTDRKESEETMAARIVAADERIRNHFQGEEAEGGVFSIVVEASPHLSVDVEELKSDHRSLCRMLDALKLLTEAPEPSDAWWNHLRREFTDFHKLLKEHERRENQLG